MSAKPSKPESNGTLQLGLGCLLLIALPFAGFGLMVAWWYVSAVGTWRDAQGWDQTTATLQTVDLRVHRDSDSTSYRVEASYDYTFNGQPFHGNRVGVFTSSDNIGDYQQKMHRRLRDAKRQNRAVTCYVNPDNPEQSLLDRSMRLGMLAMYTPFATLFTGIGVGLLAYGVPAARRDQATKRLAKLHPDEPWRWRDAWRRQDIPHTNAAKAWGLAAMSVWALAFTLPSAWIAWRVDTEGVASRIVIGVMTAAAVLLAGKSMFELWRTARYGTSRLRLATLPGVIGGPLAGVVVIPTRVTPAEGFRVRLVCREKRTVKRRGESKTRTLTLWEDEHLVLRTLDADAPNTTAVPVEFTVPSDARSTDQTGAARVTWTVEVTARSAGPDYRGSWEAPVFLTDDSRDGVGAQPPPATTQEERVPLARLARHDGVRIEESVGRLTVSVPPFRGMKLALPLLAVGLITAGSAYWLYTESQWIFVVVFTPCAAICLISAVGLALGSSRLTISGDDWTARSGWYGLRFTRRLRGGDIKRIRSRTSFRASSGDGQSYHSQHLLADLHSGHSVTLAAGIRSPRLEQVLRAELTRRAGLDTPAADRQPLDSAGWDAALDLPADDAS